MRVISCHRIQANWELMHLSLKRGMSSTVIYHYPTHQTFFSSSEKLEIGDVAFITENRKPVRHPGTFLLSRSSQNEKTCVYMPLKK